MPTLIAFSAVAPVAQARETKRLVQQNFPDLEARKNKRSSKQHEAGSLTPNQIPNH